MRKSKKKLLPKSGRLDEIRRPDKLSEKLNASLSKPFDSFNTLSKALKVIGTVITVIYSVNGLIPKKDELPLTDNIRPEMMD